MKIISHPLGILILGLTGSVCITMILSSKFVVMLFSYDNHLIEYVYIRTIKLK